MPRVIGGAAHILAHKFKCPPHNSEQISSGLVPDLDAGALEQIPDTLDKFASGRKAEAPAPAAQQDKTVGRPELPHRFLESINLGFWSSSIILEFDSSALVLLFAHRGNAKARGQRAKRTAPSFGP